MRIASQSLKVLLTLVCCVALSAAGLAARAGAARAIDLGGSVELDQAAYTAHENQGWLTITLVRSGDLSQAEHVGYGVHAQDARPGINFDVVSNHYVTMAPGQQTLSFQVRIVDQGVNATPVHALAYLYSAWPYPLGANRNSQITILRDDALATRDLTNPLGVTAGVIGDPIAGAKLYVDPRSAAARAERALAHRKPAWSRLIGDIASEPGVHRFWMWKMGSGVEGRVARYLEGTQVREPGTTVLVSTYSLVHGKCGSTATPAVEARYEDFMRQVAAGIGNFHVIFFLELDSLITAPCLNRTQLAIREAELRYAISVLEADPHVVVYLDAGAADAVPAQREARYLRDSGVAQAQGFFVNSTHFDWMSTEIHYAQTISRLLGGAHFIVNSGEAGRGPVRPRNRRREGNEILCNPPGRGLGPLSVRNDVAVPTGYLDADAFLWFDSPGNSGGPCVPGAPPTAVFWPKYAAMLARNWVHKVTGPHFPLARVTLQQAPRSAAAPATQG
jgi:endoglucanase